MTSGSSRAASTVGREAIRLSECRAGTRRTDLPGERLLAEGLAVILGQAWHCSIAPSDSGVSRVLWFRAIAVRPPRRRAEWCVHSARHSLCPRTGSGKDLAA